MYFKLSLGIDFLHHFTEHFCGCKRKKLTVHIMCSTHGRRKVHDYFLLLLCKSSIWFTEKHIFKIIIYFFNTSKCAANYVISFEVYDGFLGLNILKLWRQESLPFGPGRAAYIMRIRSWTIRLPWSEPIWSDLIYKEMCMYVNQTIGFHAVFSVLKAYIESICRCNLGLVINFVTL